MRLHQPRMTLPPGQGRRMMENCTVACIVPGIIIRLGAALVFVGLGALLMFAQGLKIKDKLVSMGVGRDPRAAGHARASGSTLNQKTCRRLLDGEAQLAVLRARVRRSIGAPPRRLVSRRSRRLLNRQLS